MTAFVTVVQARVPSSRATASTGLKRFSPPHRALWPCHQTIADDASPDAAENRRILTDRFTRLRGTTQTAIESQSSNYFEVYGDIAAENLTRQGDLSADGGRCGGARG